MKWVLFLSLCWSLHAVDFSSPEVIAARKEEGERIMQTGFKMAKFYHLAEGERYRDITDEILESPETPEDIQNAILEQDRRFVLFCYPSDDYQVKGYISYTPFCDTVPLLLFIRGGTQYFGLMHPATTYTCVKNYTVLGTTLRGSVSEGEDEFGGDEVRDIENLVAYIPQLKEDLGLPLEPNKRFILGASRGGMEMMLALQRNPSLQAYFDKAVCLSGLLDMRYTIASREDMKNMFVHHFGLTPGDNEEEWITRRNPIAHCEKLSKKLPILIIQGTEDHRAPPEEGRAMVKKLQKLGKQIDYLEIEGGDHCLRNCSDHMSMICDWLEKEDGGYQPKLIYN